MAKPKLPSTFDGLKKRLESDLDWILRDEAIYALAEHGEKALPTLTSVLESDPEWCYRASAAEAISETGSQKAVPILLRCMNEDSNEHVRSWCAIGLGDLGNSSVLPAILAAYVRAPSDNDRVGMAYAIRRLGNRRGLLYLLDLLGTGGESYVRGAAAKMIYDLEPLLDDVERRRAATKIRAVLPNTEYRSTRLALKRTLDALEGRE